MAKTYNNIYLDARQRLRRAGVEQAQLEARELICFATGKTRDELLRDMNLYAVSSVENQIESVMRRRISGEPLAYILGEWSFYGMDLTITPDVLIPRPDTEVVAERAIQIAKGAGEHARVLDLCTGSGAIGLAVAKNAPNCHVVLGDISDAALTVARKNSYRVGAKVVTTKVDALKPPTDALWDYNLIVCNPPYIRTADMETLDISVKNFEPHLALDGGEDGLKFYRFIAENWRGAMRSTCILLFEIGYDQADDVEKILAENGYRNIKRHKDAFGNWRAVEASVS